MKPGRELDALVAEKVMGLEPWPEQDPRWECKAFKAKYIPFGKEPKPCLPPEYSTDIAAAWEVIYRLPELGFIWAMSPSTVSLKRFGSEDEWTTTEGNGQPHAICLAGLMAVGFEV